MISIVVQRTGRGLYPADGIAEEDVYRLPARIDLRADVVVPSKRSLPQLRLYWAVMQVVAHKLGHGNREAVHRWVKLRAGVVDDVVERSGEIVEVPGSVGLNAMDQDAFNEFYTRAMGLICERLVDMPQDALVDEAKTFLDREDER